MKRILAFCAAAFLAASMADGQERALVFDPVADGIVLASGAAAALSTWLFLADAAAWDGTIDDALQNPLDALASLPYDGGLSGASLAAAGAAALWPALFALCGRREDLLPAAAAYGEAMLWCYAAKDLAKWLLPRTRPYARAGGGLSADLAEEALQSFPSGHTALAFCAATCLAVCSLELLPGDPMTPWLVGGGYALAAATGALRVASGNHHITDVAAGAALGTAIGWLVTSLHLRDAGSGAPNDSPAVRPGPASMTLTFRY